MEISRNFSATWESVGVPMRKKVTFKKERWQFQRLFGLIYPAVSLLTANESQTMKSLIFADNSSLHGDQYLRKCESAAFAQKILLTKLINRGAINASPNQIQCNYDGSFGNVVIENRL